MGQVRLLGWFSCMICVMHIHSIRGQVGTLSANSVQPTEVLDPVSKQAVIIAQQLLTEFQLMAADFGEAERIYDRAVASGRDIFEDEDLSEGNNELDLQPSQPLQGPTNKFCEGVPNAKPYTNMNCGCFRSYLKSPSWAGPLYNSKYLISSKNPADGMYTQMPPSSSTYFPCLATAYMRKEKLPIRTGKCGKDIALGLLEKKTGKKIPANAAEAKAMAAEKIYKKTGINPGGAVKKPTEGEIYRATSGQSPKRPLTDLGDISMKHLNETGSADCNKLQEEAAKVQCYKEEAWKHLRQAQGTSCSSLKKEAEKLKCIKTKARVQAQAVKEMKNASAKAIDTTSSKSEIETGVTGKEVTAKVEAQALKEIKNAKAGTKDETSAKSRKKTGATGKLLNAKVSRSLMSATQTLKTNKQIQDAVVEAQAMKEIKKASAMAGKIPLNPAEAKEKATEKIGKKLMLKAFQIIEKKTKKKIPTIEQHQ